MSETTEISLIAFIKGLELLGYRLIIQPIEDSNTQQSLCDNEMPPCDDELQIRKELKKLIANEILFTDFERWFFAETCCIDHNSSTSLQKLVYGVKLLFAEYSHGDWTKAELFSQIKELLAEDYCEDSIEDVLSEIHSLVERAGEFTGFNATTAKNKVILREYADKIKEATKRINIAIEMQHEVSNEDWEKSFHGLKMQRKYKEH